MHVDSDSIVVKVCFLFYTRESKLPMGKNFIFGWCTEDRIPTY